MAHSERSDMKIVMFGAGGVGGYFGGRLAAAGADVAFVARGRHLEAIRRDGLRITSPKGDVHVTGIRASADPAELGTADVVFLTVKMYDVDTAASALRPLSAYCKPIATMTASATDPASNTAPSVLATRPAAPSRSSASRRSVNVRRSTWFMTVTASPAVAVAVHSASA